MKEQKPRSRGISFSRRGFVHTAALGGVVAVTGQGAVASVLSGPGAAISEPPNEAERLMRYGGEFGGGDSARTLRNDPRAG